MRTAIRVVPDVSEAKLHIFSRSAGIGVQLIFLEDDEDDEDDEEIHVQGKLVSASGSFELEGRLNALGLHLILMRRLAITSHPP